MLPHSLPPLSKNKGRKKCLSKPTSSNILQFTGFEISLYKQKEVCALLQHYTLVCSQAALSFPCLCATEMT